MFRASSAHLQEDTVVHTQHMALSLSMKVLDGLSVHSLSENWVSMGLLVYIVVVGSVVWLQPHHRTNHNDVF